MCFAVALPSLAAAREADAPPLQILAHESFRPLVQSGVAAKPGTGSVRSLKFDAYGRRFHLALDANQRLSGALPPPDEGPALSLYQGVIENVPGSWVRMSAKAQTLRGAIWDGNELYLIDSAATLGDKTQAKADTIIFRLSDTQALPGGTFCSDAPLPASGKAAYSQLLRELKNSPVVMQAAGATARLEISALADSLFRARYASDREAQDEILSRINIVDGIYSAQLNVEIQIPTFNIDDTVAAQLSQAVDPETLISELGKLRGRTPVLRARGLTHLFTGRNLAGDTVGIAYENALCDANYGAGLTQTGASITIDALIAAHEIGHNFGAPHDGEKACAAEASGQFLMSPMVSASAQTFSQCSLAQMRPRIQAAACVLPLSAPDLDIPADLGTTHHAVGVPFVWELRVGNVGGSTAQNSEVTLLVPPVITIEDAVVVGGTCTSGAGLIHCSIEPVPAGGWRVVRMTLRSDVLGSSSISARVHSPDDAQTGNNAGYGELVINPEADLSVSAQAPAAVTAGTTVNAGFAVTNTALIDVTNVDVTLTVAGGVSIASGNLVGGNCTIVGTSAYCVLPLLAAGQSAAGTLTLDTHAMGTASLRTSVSGSYVDPTADNNSTVHVIRVTPVPTTAPARRRSGGGFLDLIALAALASLAGLRRAR